MAFRSSILPGSPLAFSSGASPNYGLAATVNPFMTQQAQAPYIANLPNYLDLIRKRSANIGGQLAGQVPEDVTRLITQRGAERGVATGTPGGPNANAAWLQALGLTSMGLQQQGQQNLSTAIADTPVPEIWNPMSLYVPQVLGQQELAAAQQGVSKKVTPKLEYSSYNPAAPWTNYQYFA